MFSAIPAVVCFSVLFVFPSKFSMLVKLFLVCLHTAEYTAYGCHYVVIIISVLEEEGFLFPSHAQNDNQSNAFKDGCFPINLFLDNLYVWHI